MTRILGSVKWLALALLGSVIFPALAPFLKSWLERRGAYDDPQGFIASILDWLIGVAATPGFYPAVFFLLGLTIGLWTDAVYRRLDGSRKRDALRMARALGGAMVYHAQCVSRRSNRSLDNWPQSIGDIEIEIRATLNKVARLGIWVPDQTIYDYEEGERLLLNYLHAIGKLLENDEFEDARDHALGAAHTWKTDVLENPDAQRLPRH